MKKFPQFLKTMPEFMGLGLFDLPLIVLGLFIGLVFQLTGVTSLVIALAMILIRKLLVSKIDFIGFMLPREKEVRLKVKNDSRGYNDTNI